MRTFCLILRSGVRTCFKVEVGGGGGGVSGWGIKVLTRIERQESAYVPTFFFTACPVRSSHLQIFAIFAFSTCGSYSGMFKMSVECKNRSDSDLGIEVKFEYPFR